MTSIVTLTSKNQLTIPSKIARALSLSAGVRLLVSVDKEIVRMEKVPTGLRDLQGIVQKTSPYKQLTIAQAKEKASKAEATRIMKS